MKALPQDKANHLAYGALIASCAAVVAHFAIIGMVGAGALPGWILQHQAVVKLTAAQGASVLAGVLKELLDRRANAKAVARGEPPPHSVERADIAYTAIGGAFVAAPLAVGAL